MDVPLQGGGKLGLEGVLVDHALDGSSDLSLDLRSVHPFLGAFRFGVGVVRRIGATVGQRWGIALVEALQVTCIALHKLGHERRHLVDRQVDVERSGDLVHVRLGSGGHVLQAALQVQGVGHVHGQLALVDGERGLYGIAVDGEQRVHIEAALLGLLVVEGFAGEHVRIGMRDLVLHDGAVGGLVDHVGSQRGGVVQPRAQHGGRRVVARLHHAHHVHVLAVRHEVAHVVGVVGLVFPHVELVVALVVVGGVHQLERDVQNVLVRGIRQVGGGFDFLFGRELLHHVVELGGVAQAQRVQHEVAHAAVAGEHEHHLGGALRPASGLHVVLVLVEARVARHLVERVGAHGHGHEAVRAGGGAQPQRGERLVGVHLAQLLGVRAVYLRRHVVGVLDGVRVLVDVALAGIEVLLERGQVVRPDARHHVRHHLHHMHGVFALVLGATRGLPALARRAEHHGRHVEAGALDLQGVLGKRLLLDRFDVVVHAVGQRQDGRDAYDADGARERCHERAALLRHEVLERQRERREERHLRAAHGLLAYAQVFGSGNERVGVAANDTVGEVHDAGGVLLRELGVVRDHDDQTVVRDLGEQVHDLDARL